MVFGKGKYSYRFADFTLEESEHCLLQGDQEIYLRPKSFEVLLYLVQRHGHLVTKDELLDHVWRDTVVTETAMTHCIEEVRKALGDQVHRPRYLKTIPRLGYKFIAPVTKISSTKEEIVEEEITAVKVLVTEDRELAPDRYDDLDVIQTAPFRLSHRLPASMLKNLASKVQTVLLVTALLVLLVLGVRYIYHRHRPAIQSLAVLPLVNLNADSSHDYLADGLTEALICELANISSIRVISRTSAMQYKGISMPLADIAHALSVDAILEGSLFYSGDRVRINAQLIQARPERHLWGESYERTMSDVLALQREVTRAIARGINARLTPQEATNLTRFRQMDPDAYRAYLKGRYFWNKRTPDGFRKGIDCFEQAIALDPLYALAYAGLADCYNGLYDFDVLAPAEAAPKARAAALKAIAIDATLADAYASLAFVTARYDWAWQEAERNFLQAIELNNNYSIAHHWYALHLAMLGRFDEAIVAIHKALDLDPLSLIVNTNVGWIFYFAGRYNDAEAQLLKAVDMDPNFLSAHVKLGWVYEQQGKYEPAIEQLKIALSLSGEDANILALLGRSYALAGRTTEARRILTNLMTISLQQYISPYWIGLIYASLGDNDQAFQWLNEAVKERSGGLVWLKVEPKLDKLRLDPRFSKLLTTIQLK